MKKTLSPFAKHVMAGRIMKIILKCFFVIATAMLLANCSEKQSVQSPTHPAGWSDQGSEEFHGKFVEESVFKNESCKTCHGEDYQGGTSGVSCYTAACHAGYPHPQGFADSSNTENFHAAFIRSVVRWDIRGCRNCHGADYEGDGENPRKNCRSCHTETNGPEACNTCHGSKLNAAPPRDLSGNQLPSSPGVGAHQIHVADTSLTLQLFNRCESCHKTPLIPWVPGHIDRADGRAEILFDSLAHGAGEAAFSAEAGSCANVYCHGAFTLYRDSSAFTFGYADSLITGNYEQKGWTDTGGTPGSCAGCHDMPPRGHVAATTCNACHGRVVDGEFNIIDKRLHINGQTELF